MGSRHRVGARVGVWVGVAVVGAAAAVASPAHATISQALSLDELVDQADHVVLATCVDARASRDGRRRIVTDFTLRVEESMKGDAASGASLTLRRLGGAIGDLGMQIAGEPHLEVGRRYLVFLRTLSDGRTLRPVGMSQGVMPVHEDATGELTVQPGGDGMALVQRAAGGQLVPAPAALIHPEPYPLVRGRVEQIVDREGGAVAP